MNITYDTFEAYGQTAEKLDNPTLIAGRNPSQAEAEKNIVSDIKNKLDLNGNISLLEIGCGIGNLLIPLSEYVKSAIGIDHPSCIKKFKNRNKSNIRLVAGRWPEQQPKEKFNCILAYSVIHYLSDARNAETFISACLDKLKPGGKLLLGDIPNIDTQNRFANSPFGREFIREWEKRKSQFKSRDLEIRDEIFRQAHKPERYLDDDFLLKILKDTRSQGYESYLLPQSSALPFFHTREDILIRKRA